MTRLAVSRSATGLCAVAIAGALLPGRFALAQEAEPEMPVEVAPEAGPAAPGKPARKRRSGKPTGYAVFDEKLRRRPAPRPSGNLYLHNVYRRESLKINIYNLDGSYNVDALRALSHLLRCKRTDTEIPMEPRLFAILSHVYDHFGEPRIQITSGYRNQRKTTSNHYRGSAADIHIPGVRPSRLRAFIESLDSGGMGVGIYPKSGFVHVDVRPPPSYRWIDYSPVDRNDPNRRPPRYFKKRKGLS